MGGFSGRIAVIGAGASGLAASKWFQQNGIAFDTFEKYGEVGGLWHFRVEPEKTSIYRSCYINTSKQLTAFSDFEMPADIADYPHSSEMDRYFNAYVDHFGLRPKIQFNTEVVRVEPVGDEYDVTVRRQNGNTETRRYQGVAVCNGHHWDPMIPEFPGRFEGPVVHSSRYKVPEPYIGQRVLVVGLGNSGIDIATEMARHAAKTCVSIRRGYHIFPKFVGGVPVDHLQYGNPMAWWPRQLKDGIRKLSLKFIVPDPAPLGIPRPEQDFKAQHGTISSEFLPRVGQGDIRIRPNIRRFDGNTVEFVDGSREEFDAIIMCTGYRVTFPFLDPSVMKVENNRVWLYKYVVHPERKNLFFFGLIQPWGSIIPISEMQVRWICEVLQGRLPLPSKASMHADIEKKWERIQAQYVAHTRHTLQVEQEEYMLELWREMVPPGPFREIRQQARRLDPFGEIVRNRIRKSRRARYQKLNEAFAR